MIGYCFGGTIAWLAAARLGVDSAVGYYGGQIANFANEHPKAPTMLHFGKLDQHIPKASIDAVEAANPRCRSSGTTQGHGFNCNDRASYNAEAAKLAKERSLDFEKAPCIDLASERERWVGVRGASSLVIDNRRLQFNCRTMIGYAHAPIGGRSPIRLFHVGVLHMDCVFALWNVLKMVATIDSSAKSLYFLKIGTTGTPRYSVTVI